MSSALTIGDTLPEYVYLDKFIDEAKAFGTYSFDIEHPPGYYTAADFRLCGCSFATKGQVIYIRNLEHIRYVCAKLFPDPNLDAIAYNAKSDLRGLLAAGAIPQHGYPINVVDPMVAVNLLNDNRRPNQLGLKVVVYDVFGHIMKDWKTAWKAGEHSKEFEEYAKEDASWEFQLWDYLKPKLEAEGLMKVFRKILMPVTKVFADMETVGIGWDFAEARRLLHGYQSIRNEMESEIKGVLGDINLNSGDQVAKSLFTDLGYSTKGIERTKSDKRYSVDEKAMETLAGRYPICNKIKLYRTAAKMIGTYVEPMTQKALADPHGRIHPSFWLVSATGRTRCEDPNLQNIPAFLDKLFSHLSIRKAIVPAPGRVMIVADLSQIELRLCGHISGDAEFIKAYRNWTCTACGSTGSEVFQILHKCPKCGIDENELVIKKGSTVKGFWHGEDIHSKTTDNVAALKGNRQHGKTANFAIIYYATAFRLHCDFPDFTTDEWQEIIDQFLELYAGVRKWHLSVEQILKNTGWLSDLFGRKRRILREDVLKNFKHALNTLINFPVQSSACEYIQLCQIKIREHFLETGDWLANIFPSNFIHDEVVYECPESMVPTFKPIIQHYLENTVRFSVPIRTSIKVVTNWGDAK